MFNNLLIYGIPYKASYGATSLRIIFDKCVLEYDETKYLVLFGPKKYESIFNRIRFLKKLKSNFSYVVSQNYSKIKIDLDDDLLLEETLAMNNVVILSSKSKSLLL